MCIRDMYLVFLIITLGMFAYLLTGVFRLQVVESEEYANLSLIHI